MKYIGNKTRLLNFIEQSMIESEVPFKGTFCDLFGGTGSVGRYFKEKGFKVISNDLMTYSYIIQYVSVYLNRLPAFDKLKMGNAEAVIQYLNKLAPINGYIFENFAPSGKCGRQYFSDSNAQKIDAIREQVEDWYKKDCITIDEYYVLLSALIDAADFVANISGTYGAYLKIWRSMALKELKLKVPTLYDNNKDNEIYNIDANNLIEDIDCDVLYIDPPYNERQYASNFHVLESLAVWDKQILFGKTGQRDYASKKSKYCSKSEAMIVFEDLIAKAKAKYIIVSYNSEGIIPGEKILDILRTRGKVKEFTTDYRRFRTERDSEHRHYKKCGDKVVEYLYIVTI